METSPPLLRLSNISRRFSGVLANDRVSLDLQAGELHALLGENGAGKRTLMNILYGLYSPDSGEIFFEGRPVRVGSPAQALRLGIALVPQHPLLVERHTVAENLALGLPGDFLLTRRRLQARLHTPGAQPDAVGGTRRDGAAERRAEVGVGWARPPHLKARKPPVGHTAALTALSYANTRRQPPHPSQAKTSKSAIHARATAM